MRARQFLERKAAAHSADTGQAMLQAFDEAWSFVAHSSGNDPKVIDAARLRLAECIAIVTPTVSTDVEQIRLMALNMLRIIDRHP